MRPYTDMKRCHFYTQYMKCIWEHSVDSNISPRTWITSYGVKIVIHVPFTFLLLSHSPSHPLFCMIKPLFVRSFSCCSTYLCMFLITFRMPELFNLNPCWMCVLFGCLHTHLMYQSAFATWMIRIMMTWCCRQFLIRSLSNGSSSSSNKECTQVKRCTYFHISSPRCARSWWKNANRLLLSHCLCCFARQHHSTYNPVFFLDPTHFSLSSLFFLLSVYMKAHEYTRP